MVVNLRCRGMVNKASELLNLLNTKITIQTKKIAKGHKVQIRCRRCFLVGNMEKKKAKNIKSLYWEGKVKEKIKPLALLSSFFFRESNNNENLKLLTEKLQKPVQKLLAPNHSYASGVVWFAGWYVSGAQQRLQGDGWPRRCWGRGVGARAGYLSVERGGISESRWEGRRQLRRVQRVWRPHVWAAGIESGHCELICGRKKRRSGVRSAACDRG